MLSKTYTKYIQSLHHKKFRDMQHAFIAEGSKVVMDLINSKKIVCEHIVGKEEWLRENESLIRVHYTGPLESVEAYELEKISALSTPNQVLGIFKKPVPGRIEVKGKITLALDTIQDPGNLGTIIRIADWFGIKAIICSENCADAYIPKVVQSSMGSLGRVEIMYTGLVEWIKENSAVCVYAAALQGKNVAQVEKIQEGVIIIGNESKGISEALMQMANEKITIARIGQAESLNAAVATGIILSHVIVAT